MNNHVGHLEGVLAFTVQMLKQEIGNKIKKKKRVNFYVKK